MARVLPAILAATKVEYDEKLAVVRQLTDRFQLDVIDGQFVDNKTVNLVEIEKIGGIKIDLHLMVNDPVAFAKAASRLMPHLVIVQYECGQDVVVVLKSVKVAGQKVGLAINPQTTVEEIKELLPEIDHLLIMMYPAGFAGQTFEADNLVKIAQARAIRPDLEIGIDGGVNSASLAKIAQAKPDIVNVNSYLFEADDPASRYSELMEALK